MESYSGRSTEALKTGLTIATVDRVRAFSSSTELIKASAFTADLPANHDCRGIRREAFVVTNAALAILSSQHSGLHSRRSSANPADNGRRQHWAQVVPFVLSSWQQTRLSATGAIQVASAG